MTIALALSLIVTAIAIPERELALALYRRWQGASTGRRAVKVACLCIHEAVWWLWAVSPLLPPLPWGGSQLLAEPAALAALAGLPIYAAAVTIWFVYRHDNGGYQGTGGPARYGWAGYGYLWAYPIRDYIGEVKLAGWTIVQPRAWTEAAELYLGAMTGHLTAPALAALHILAWVAA